MIKICHIVNLISGKADGVFAHLKMIFSNCDRSKYIHIIIFQGGDVIECELQNLDIKYFVVKSLKKKIAFDTFISINKIIREENPDILHTHLIKPYTIVGLLNIIHHKIMIFNYHGLFISNPYNSFFEKMIYSIIHNILFLLNTVDLAIVPSQNSKKLLLKETKLFPSIKVYYNGYDFKKTVPLPDANVLSKIEEIKSKDKFILGFIGRICLEKRFDIILQILSELLKKNLQVHLIVFGDGESKFYYEILSEKLQIKNHISFQGYVTGMENYYKYLDAVLFASDWEGMPLVLWESLANGIPVVAPDVGGFNEILQINNCGLVYQKSNEKEAVELLTDLINDKNKRIKLGKNGSKAVEDIYNANNFISTIESIYGILLSNK